MFWSLGISHRKAGERVRDKVSLPAREAELFRSRLAELGISQSVVLSTCNRCEAFFCGDAAAPGKCRSLFLRTFPEVDFGGILETRKGVDALAYLFRVAAGLESMILGEYQVLGQVKDAYAASLAGGCVSRELDRIMRDAISCAKRVKTELDIGAVPPSVCRAGIEFVDRTAGFAGKRVFVIGSGRTGTLAAKLARRFGAKSIAVCNRSPERTRRLVEEIGAETVGYDSRYEAISRSDIVVSATASPHVVVQAARVEIARPVVFLDLASPRDVDAAVAGNPLATLVSIDTIGELASGETGERERLAAKGMEIVAAAVAATAKWLEGLG
jgi:glutamyl-tRNA reductase